MKSTLNWGSPFDEAQLAEESQPSYWHYVRLSQFYWHFFFGKSIILAEDVVYFGYFLKIKWPLRYVFNALLIL